MRLSVRAVAALSISLSFLAAGCGDSDTGDPGDSGPASGEKDGHRPGGPGSAGSVSGGAATPQGCFDEIQKARKANDIAGFFALLTPDSRKKTLADLYMVAWVGARMDEGSKRKWEAVLEKHGAKDVEGMPRGMEAMAKAAEAAVAGVKDLGALAADIDRFVKETGKSSDGMNLSEDSGGTMTDLVVGEKKATAKWISKNEAGLTREEPVEFHEIDGRWFLQLGK
ncbi:MAG: hypothetical protein HY720_06880 [Planctomycetes bacterium]|nr:hypothetical protein [Planctomycetota bacterium]